jgi:hypothetical protein
MATLLTAKQHRILATNLLKTAGRPGHASKARAKQMAENHETMAKMIEHRAAMPDLKTLQTKLAGVRQEISNLQVMQMRPGQSPEKLEVLKQLERSARAELKLRQKALAHQQTRKPVPPDAAS